MNSLSSSVYAPCLMDTQTKGLVFSLLVQRAGGKVVLIMPL